MSKILIVDDSEIDRRLLVNALVRKGGFQMIEAKSGEECLEVIASEPVDLVLMDVLMPGALGTQVLLKIREKFSAIELPIIMVTAKVDASDIISGLQNGANDYITKPVMFDVAVSRISTHLKLSEMAREMSRLRELFALDAIIATYNHEINNPLASAILHIDALDLNEPLVRDGLKSALWRIADIIKKIRTVAQEREVKYADYTQFTKMIKID